MRTFLTTIVLTCLLPMKVLSQDKQAYTIYNAEGREVKWNKMMKDISSADVVFFGEQHNDPISHWLELQIMKDLYTYRDGMIIAGAEMFERDNQVILDEFLAGKFDDSKFEDDARLWKNYPTDYKPLTDFALKNKIRFVATNIPRRYANMVYRGGFESLGDLSDEAKRFMAPMPIEYDPELPCYKKMMSMGMGHSPSENLPRAQAVKDATMGYFIAENIRPGYLMIHFNGEYHSENKEGILWYLNKYKPGLNVRTISVVFQEGTGELEEGNRNIADYIIVVPEDMTRTY